MNYSVYNEDAFESILLKEQRHGRHAQFVKQLTNESIIPIERYNNDKRLINAPMNLVRNMNDKRQSKDSESDLKRQYIESEILQSRLISPAVTYN